MGMTLKEILSMSYIEPESRPHPTDVAGCNIEWDENTQKWTGHLGSLTSTQAADLQSSGVLANVASGTTRMIDGVYISPRYVPGTRNKKAFSVMSSQPTVSSSTINPRSSGQFFGATGFGTVNGDAVGNSAFSLFRGANFQQGSLTSPRYGYLIAGTFTGPSGPSYLSYQVSFIHYGSTFTLSIRSGGGAVIVKVDDEFLSDINPANDGSLQYYTFDFDTISERRIDVIFKLSQFGGIWVNHGDSVHPAIRRGPRTVVMSDSFGEGTGLESYSNLSWIEAFAEYMGWDDVISSAVGGTGIIAGNSPKVNFQDRCVSDAAGVNADLIIIKMSVNDAGYTPESIVSGIGTIISRIRSAGSNADVLVFSSTTSGGYGRLTLNQIRQNSYVESWCSSNGVFFVNGMNIPYGTMEDALQTTLTVACANGATSITTSTPLVSGSHYKFADGTGFFVRAISGLVATVSPIYNSHAVGESIVETGSTTFTGNGNSGATVGWGSADVCISRDGTHPLARGHRTIGNIDSMIVSMKLNN